MTIVWAVGKKMQTLTQPAVEGSVESEREANADKARHDATNDDRATTREARGVWRDGSATARLTDHNERMRDTQREGAAKVDDEQDDDRRRNDGEGQRATRHNNDHDGSDTGRRHRLQGPRRQALTDIRPETPSSERTRAHSGHRLMYSVVASAGIPVQRRVEPDKIVGTERPPEVAAGSVGRPRAPDAGAGPESDLMLLIGGRLFPKESKPCQCKQLPPITSFPSAKEIGCRTLFEVVAFSTTAARLEGALNPT